jgi:hypothetical protein
MIDKLIFNHESLPCNSQESARTLARSFLKVCQQAKAHALSTIVLDSSIAAKWFEMELTSNFTWKSWQADLQNEDRDLWRAFLSIATTSQFYDQTDIESELQLIEVLLEGERKSEVLRAAYWHKIPILSFPTAAPWDRTPVVGTLNQLDQDSQINSSSHEFTNIFDANSLNCHIAQYQLEHDQAIRNSRELWNARNTTYPHLRFCGKAKQQIANWRYSDEIFKHVKDSLNGLEQFATQWTAGTITAFSHAALIPVVGRRSSGESESTNKNAECIGLRTFRKDDGNNEYFEDHIKLPNLFRIHFLADESQKVFHVGYIGPHLKTAGQ